MSPLTLGQISTEIAEVDHDTAGDDIVDFNAPLCSARQTSLRYFEMRVVAVSIEHIRLKVHWCQIVRGIGVCPKVVCKFAGVAGKTLIAAIWKFCGDADEKLDPWVRNGGPHVLEGGR